MVAPVQSNPADPAEWLDSIERRIHKRTWGRIDQLQVADTGNGIVVRGLASSFYDKQLAIQAVLEWLGGQSTTDFSLDIAVREKRRRH
jgi:hypothetical protein